MPLDPAWLAERLAHVLADCEAALVITGSASSARLSGTPRVLLDHDAGTIAAAAARVPVEPLSEQLTYIIYTSSSTGVRRASRSRTVTCSTWLPGTSPPLPSPPRIG